MCSVVVTSGPLSLEKITSVLSATPSSFQRRQQLADDVVHLEDEVAVRPRVGLALERSAGNDGRCTACIEWNRKNGCWGCSLTCCLEERRALLEEDEVDLFEIEVRRDHARGGCRASTDAWAARLCRFSRSSAARDAVAVDVGVEPVGGRAAGRAEELVEAAVDRAVGDRPGEVDRRTRSSAGRLRASPPLGVRSPWPRELVSRPW